MEYEKREKEFDLSEYWRVIVKRKTILFTFASTLILVVGIYTFTSSPMYKSTTKLLIEEEERSKILSIEDMFSYRSLIKDTIFLNTQKVLLESDSLAERVARKMNLLSRPEFGAVEKTKKSLMGKIKDVVTFRWISSKNEVENNAFALSDPYSKIAKKLQNNIDVSQIRDTKVMKLSYTSGDPVLAAEIANTIAEEFITFSIEKRYEITQQASDFLSVQIANLREDLASKEREIQKYRQEKELFFLSDKESTAVSKFADINDAFTQAQIDRIKAETNYRQLKDVKVDSLPRTVENRIIQNLEQEYSRIKNEYEEKSKIYKPDYPEMIQLEAKRDSMRDELKGEIKKAVDLAEAEYRAALKKERSLENLLEEQMAEVDRMDSSAIVYNSLKIEVENKRKLLDSLVERQNETLVSAELGGLKIGNISIIDRAKVPERPISPKKKLNLILALLMGIFGGVGLCFVFEYLDKTVKGPEDVERLAGVPSLGVIPYFVAERMGKRKKKVGKGGKRGVGRGAGADGTVGRGAHGGGYGFDLKYKASASHGKANPRNGKGKTDIKERKEIKEIKEIELINHFYPKFSISEDYRTVRTSILLSHAENHPKTIAFSSALPEEGKTVTVANMAVAFAQLNKRVLIIDSDLRKPRMHRLFKVRSVSGLSGYLSGNVSIDDVVQKTNIENISIIPSGITPPNPAELLDSEKMKELMEGLKERFDVVLMDTPPLLAVVDSMVVGSFADSVVLIVQSEKTTQKPFLRAVEQLRQSKAKIMGVIFNQAKVRKGDYYYMDYYQYRGGHEEEENSEA